MWKVEPQGIRLCNFQVVLRGISIVTILYNNNKNVFTYFRYKANRAILREELNKLGFKQLVPEKNAGYIITSYLCPKHPNFSFKQFYSKLSDKGICIALLMYTHYVLFGYYFFQSSLTIIAHANINRVFL